MGECALVHGTFSQGGSPVEGPHAFDCASALRRREQLVTSLVNGFGHFRRKITQEKVGEGEEITKALEIPEYQHHPAFNLEVNS